MFSLLDKVDNAVCAMRMTDRGRACPFICSAVFSVLALGFWFLSSASILPSCGRLLSNLVLAVCCMCVWSCTGVFGVVCGFSGYTSVSFSLCVLSVYLDLRSLKSAVLLWSISRLARSGNPKKSGKKRRNPENRPYRAFLSFLLRPLVLCLLVGYVLVFGVRVAEYRKR